MLNLLSILRHGLFCVMAASLLLNLSLVCFAGAAAGALWSFESVLKGATYGLILILFATLLGSVGMLMCFAVPDTSSRWKIGLAVMFEVLGIIFSFIPVWFVWILGRIFLLLGWFFFLRFLLAVGESVGSSRVDDIVTAIFWIAGLNCSAVWVVFFISIPLWLLVIVTIWLVDAALYSYLLWTLVKDLGPYIEGIKSGAIDPTASKSKAAPTLFNRVSGAAKGPPSEEPTGPPPEGANIYKAPKSLPPLHLAVKEGDALKVSAELQKGTKIDEKTRNDLAAIHIAAIFGVMETADALLRSGANVNETCERGLTPLFLAIQTGNLNLVGFLVNKGANLDHANEDGLTPLHWACCAPHERMKGPTRTKMVMLLADKGAKFDAVDKQGRTPRAVAEANGLKQLVEAIDRHQGVLAPPPPLLDSGQLEEPIVETAVEPVFTLEGSELVQQILPDQVKLSRSGVQFCSTLPPLHAETKVGDTEKVLLQLEKGADPNSKAESGLTALHIAAMGGVMAVADLLIKRGARVDETCDGGLTALYFAIQQNNAAMVGLLLSRGASLRHCNDQRRTPLHWACAVPSPKLEGQLRVKLVQLLLQKGADPNAQDENIQTPKMLAQAAQREDVAQAIDRFVTPEDRATRDDDD